MLSFTFQLYIQRNLQGIFIIIKVKLRLSDVFFNKRESALRKITFGFDQLHRLIEKDTGG